MTQLLAVVLVCAATVAPADCTRETATDLVVQPAPSAAPTACLLAGEAVVAGGALGRDMPAGAYLKIGCERRKG